MKMEFDASELTKALQSYKKATKKDSQEVIMRAMRNIGFRAFKFTDGANKDAIKASLTNQELLFKVLNTRRKKQGLPSLGNKPMSDPAKHFLAQRVGSSKYIAAGWLVPLMKMGIPTHARRSVSDYQKKHGTVTLPTILQLDGIMVNGSIGAADSAAGVEGLEKAMADVAKDMAEYAAKKMAKTAGEHSGK